MALSFPKIAALTAALLVGGGGGAVYFATSNAGGCQSTGVGQCCYANGCCCTKLPTGVIFTTPGFDPNLCVGVGL